MQKTTKCQKVHILLLTTVNVKRVGNDKQLLEKQLKHSFFQPVANNFELFSNFSLPVSCQVMKMENHTKITRVQHDSSLTLMCPTNMVKTVNKRPLIKLICSHLNNAMHIFLHLRCLHVHFLFIKLVLLYFFASSTVFLIQINNVSFHPLTVAVCIQFKVLVLVH